MFWFGKNTERKFDDYRPEVHDSDGLLVKMGNGEILWRPLDNPPALRHQVFHAPNIRGFGLLQRERSFRAYEDTFNFYQQVPSVWVEPRGNWGDGDLHLVELSTRYEGLDNIVAFWDPKNKPAPLQALPLRLPALLAGRRGGLETFRKPRRLHARRPGHAFREHAAVRHGFCRAETGRRAGKRSAGRPSPIAAPTPPSWTIWSCATRFSTAGAWS